MCVSHAIAPHSSRSCMCTVEGTAGSATQPEYSPHPTGIEYYCTALPYTTVRGAVQFRTPHGANRHTHTQNRPEKAKYRTTGPDQGLRTPRPGPTYVRLLIRLPIATPRATLYVIKIECPVVGGWLVAALDPWGAGAHRASGGVAGSRLECNLSPGHRTDVRTTRGAPVGGQGRMVS